MLIFVTAWVIGGGLFALGARYLLHVKRAQYDHDERMAEIANDRARLDDELEQSRAERASRSRPDLNREEIAEALAAINAPTEVLEPAAAPLEVEVSHAEWPSDPASWWAPAPVDEGEENGKHRLPTLS